MAGELVLRFQRKLSLETTLHETFLHTLAPLISETINLKHGKVDVSKETLQILFWYRVQVILSKNSKCRVNMRLLKKMAN